MTNTELHDALQRLYDSTAAFHDRFNTPRDLIARKRVFGEECVEYLLAGTHQEMEEEAADVLVTAIGIYDLLYTPEDKPLFGETFGLWPTPHYDYIWYDVGMVLTHNTPKTVMDWLIEICEYMAKATSIEAINAVIEKNEKKTTDTHVLGKHGKVVER